MAASVVSTSTPPALEVQGIVKRFRGVDVLRGVQLRIEPGEIVVLYGPNGAGKTTLLRILATLARPNAGTFSVRGLPGDERDRVREHLAFAGHGTQLYDDLNSEENLRFLLGLHGIVPAVAEVQLALEKVGLWRFRFFVVATFSAGMKRRLALARLMLMKPDLLLLDEPYTSLDAAGSDLVNSFLTEFVSGGGAVLLSSHAPERSAGLTHRAVWMHEGRLQGEAPRHVA